MKIKLRKTSENEKDVIGLLLSNIGGIIGILYLIALVSPLGYAEDSIGTYQQDSCVEIKQTCSSCSYVNISVSYPNSTRAITNQNMSLIGSGSWVYEFCNTSNLGRYNVMGEGDIDGSAESFATYFKITPSGSDDLSSGSGLALIGSLSMIVIVGIFFFVLSFRLNSPTAKIAFIIISSIIFMISIFYSMVIVQQTLGEFSNLIDGYSTFFMVLEILAIISILALMIVAILISIRFYKFKRGLID